MSEPLRLHCAATDAVVVERLEVADGIWSRFWGLQFRRTLAPGAGLLLVPCGAVHTCFLRFAIDVVLLDRQGTVLAVQRAVRPWRLVSPVRGAHATLEVLADSARVTVGSCLVVRGTTIPRSLRFLHSEAG